MECGLTDDREAIREAARLLISYLETRYDVEIPDDFNLVEMEVEGPTTAAVPVTRITSLDDIGPDDVVGAYLSRHLSRIHTGVAGVYDATGLELTEHERKALEHRALKQLTKLRRDGQNVEAAVEYAMQMMGLGLDEWMPARLLLKDALRHPDQKVRDAADEMLSYIDVRYDR